MIYTTIFIMHLYPKKEKKKIHYASAIQSRVTVPVPNTLLHGDITRKSLFIKKNINIKYKELLLT